LNHSNIGVQYNTGSNYIIETVKSDLYLRDTRTDITSNLLAEPTVISPAFTESIRTFAHSGGTEAQTTYTITIGQNTICDILIVGGGGGGGFAGSNARGGGGGGAGQFLLKLNYLLNAGTYNIKIGNGGLGGSISTSTNTILLESFGGGGGARGKSGTLSNGLNGASGGGGCGDDFTNRCLGGTALTQFVNNNTLYTGYNGANGGPAFNGGGGGGYTSAGYSSTNTNAGDGGNGITNDITGIVKYYCAGGGGGGYNNGVSVGTRGGNGGNISAGNGGNYTGSNGTNATNGSGSGGGGAGVSVPGGSAYNGGNGGSGIVIIKFKSTTAISEGNPITHKTLNFAYNNNLVDLSQPNTYTLNFPVPTIADINNNSNIVLCGAYDISLSSMNSSIIPKSGQYIPKLLPLTTSNISIRYNLLNPTLDPIGAQWTYNSSNINVYHMGNVGIGTKSPEYHLDVRGSIYSSLGGYTQTGLTTWSIASDRRIKENIVKASYEKCLENVKNIELYNFNFKDDCVNTNDKHQLGFIAQEVQQVYPKAVEVGKMILNTNEKIDDLLSLNTTQIDYTLYGAVKNLIEKIEDIDNELGNIERKI
jgi:hypothetical protein